MRFVSAKKLKVEVINDLLGYDGLKIIQRPDMFNFSLDSLILAYFSPVTKRTKKIIDLCSGNGPIPLFLTLKTNSQIDCVEIQDDAYDLLIRSIKLNNLENQIKPIHADLKGVSKSLDPNTYDLLTVNPPYFKVKESSHINDSIYKTLARHEVLVNFEEICIEAKKLLKTKGYFCFIHRPDRLSELFSTLRKYHIEPKELYFIYPNKNKNANHMLVICQNDANCQVKVHQPIYVYDENNNYTEVMKSIFNFHSVL